MLTGRCLRSCLTLLVVLFTVASASAGARVSEPAGAVDRDSVPSAARSLDRAKRATRAADVSGTIIAGGASQVVTISTAGDKARITFDGVANRRVSLNITNVSIPISYVSIQKPAGAGDLVSPTPVFSSGKFIDAVTLPSAGTYTIYINPQSNGTGSITLTLYDVSADVTGSIVAGGSTVASNTTVPGQNARYTFSATQGQRVSLAISGISLSPSGSLEIVSLLSPTGSTLVGSGAISSTGWIDTTTIPTSGTYTVLVDPTNAATGSSNLTLYDVPADVTGALTPSQAGDVLSPSTSTPGQNARLSFSGALGQRVSLKISGVTLSGGGTFETVSILKPDGSTLVGSGVVLTSGWIDTQTLPSTGTYTVLIDPDKGTTSTSTIRAYDVPPDFSATIDPASDNAVDETTTVPGQDARLTFSGVAGVTVYIPRGGVTTPTSWVKLLKSDGTQLAGTPLLGAGESTLSATLPTSGTYTVLVDGYQDAIGSATLAVSDEDAVIGGLSSVQPDLSLVDPDPTPAPVPVSPTGPLAAGSYSTEVWSSYEVGNETGLAVVSTTDPGTYSVTGIVKDQTTQFPIQGATVTITAGGATVSTTTDADGAWALANVPAQSTQTTVTPPAPWGTYQGTNGSPSADTTYERTIELTTSPQTEDDSVQSVDLAQQTTGGQTTDAYSQTRVPATISVRILNVYPLGDPDNNCHPLPGEPAPGQASPYRPVRTFPFWYYLLRIGQQEVGAYNFNQVAMKAFFSIAQNFAWEHKTEGGSFDVDNSSNYQCFRISKSVDRRWRGWLDDVLDERVAKQNNRLLLTTYRGLAPEACSDPHFPEHEGTANQWVIKGLSELDCPRLTDWRDIVKYFYPTTTQIKSGARPFLPTTGVVHFPDHTLRITFTSYFRGNNTVQNVAWSYQVVQSGFLGIFISFREVKPTGFNAVPTHLDFTTAQASGTHRYYVRACNPVGCSQAAQVRDSNTGLDITG